MATDTSFTFFKKYGFYDLYVTRDMLTYGFYQKGPKMYNVTNEAGTKLGAYATEDAAILIAEAMAKSNPGREFYVTKAVTKSYVAPAPSITTRL